MAQTEEQIVQNIRQVFQRYDTDNSGFIELNEFGKFYEDFTRDFEQKESKENVLKAFDSSQDGKVSVEEFIKYWLDDIKKYE